MVSTKLVDNTIPAIELRLKSFSGDMVRIEYLENCLKQILPNDVKRFCHLKLADFYANRLMWTSAAKNMDLAVETATTYKDKINYCLKEISLLIKANDYILIDKPYKKAMNSAGTPKEKEDIKNYLKTQLTKQAEDFEKKNKRSNASSIYQRILEIYGLVNEQEKKQILEKLANLNAKLGRIREAKSYETMLSKPITVPRDPETNVKKVDWKDLGIDFY
jgi:hypothetical protein